MNVLGIPGLCNKFEIVILLIRVNAYFQYGKRVSEYLIVALYYSCIVMYSFRRITRSAKGGKYF
jgi:hypothetical protein